MIDHIFNVSYLLAESLSAKNIAPLFPEYELVTEPEQTAPDKSDSADEEDVSEYQKYTKENAVDESATVSDKDWEEFAAESKKINSIIEDKKFLEFKKRISNDPDQVCFKLNIQYACFASLKLPVITWYCVV